MVSVAPLRLPGQTRYASARLKSAVTEIQSRSQKPVIFTDIHQNPEIPYASIVQGYHADRGDTWLIWLDAVLPYSAQEAVAAHEIAHILEHLDHFPVARHSQKSEDTLVSALNNLVLDDHADRWAIRHGFRIDAALRKGKLAEFQDRLMTTPSETGAAHEPSETRHMALNYAGLKVRLGRFRLFEKIDESWRRLWPASRELGSELAQMVAECHCEDAAGCRHLMLEIAHKLGMGIRW